MKDTSPRNEIMLSNTKGESVTMLFSAEISSKFVHFFTVGNVVGHYLSPHLF